MELPILVLSAPSGGGKNTIIGLLMSRFPSLRHSVSTTTRPARNGEKDGENYHFVSEQEFTRMILDNEFAEYARVHNNLYGTTFAELRRIAADGGIPILDIDVQGADKLKKAGWNVVTIFILPPDLQTLENRLISRGTEDPDQIAARMDEARREIEQAWRYDHRVVNDDLTAAVDEVAAILKPYLPAGHGT